MDKSIKELSNLFIDSLSGNVKETTLKGYRVCLDSFNRYLIANDIGEPCEEDIQGYNTFLNNSDDIQSAGTKNRYLRVVKQFFSWTAKKGLYNNVADEVKKAKVKNDNNKREAFSEEDMQAIISSIDTSDEQGARNYFMVILAVTGGLRVCELHRANLSDIQTVRGQRVIYIQGKGRDEKDEYIKLIPECDNALKHYLSYRPDCKKNEPLLVGTSNRSKGKRLSLTTISNIFKEVFINAGYDSSKLTAHSLRHTSNTLLFKAGADLYQVQNHARHSDPKTTEIYLHALDREQDRSEEQIFTQIFSSERNTILNEVVTAIRELTSEELISTLSFIEELREGKNIKLRVAK